MLWLQARFLGEFGGCHHRRVRHIGPGHTSGKIKLNFSDQFLKDFNQKLNSFFYKMIIKVFTSLKSGEIPTIFESLN
jgi:hypothetical protein